MTSDQLLTFIQSCLAGDQVLVDWCVANIGQKPSIQVDYDEDRQIDDESYPLISLATVAGTGRIADPLRNWQLGILVAVRDASVQVETHSITGARLRTYTGRLLVEGLRDQVVESLYRAKIGRVSVKDEAGSRTYVPRFYAVLQADISNITTTL